MPNEYPQEIVDKILAMTRKFPSYSYVRIAGQLQIKGISVSPGGVMTELALKAITRMKRLEQATDRHVVANRPGELISQDLYFVGVVKGVGKIYLQSAVDYSCSVGLIHEKVGPFYDSLGVPLSAILTDCGREYCGRPDSHYFELYLGSQNVEHRTTRPASPYTNGFAERFHRTLKDEFFAKVFRERIYTSVEELQQDFDAFLEFYNTGRVHSGYRCEGRTPMQTLKDLLAQPMSEATELQAA